MTDNSSPTDSKWLRHLEMSQGRSGFKQTTSYRYHEFTKHTLESLYSSSHRLDWSTQANPFREYEDCCRVDLPRKMHADNFGFFETINRMSSCFQEAKPALSKTKDSSAISISTLSELLYYSMAISAWKQIKGTDQKWALRVNPSSGNLHPSETHILIGDVNGIGSGAYHYYVRTHQLEERSKDCVIDLIWQSLDFSEPAPPLMLVLNSIFWREAWKYRDRAYRYCQLDMGHAIASVCLSAAKLGWKCQVISEFPDKDIAEYLGLSQSDEKPMVLIAVYPGISGSLASLSGAQEKKKRPKPKFTGQANTLSSARIRYESIESVYEAGCIDSALYRERKDKKFKLNTPELFSGLDSFAIEELALKEDRPFHQIVRSRRSAVAMDGRARCSLARLALILSNSSRGFKSSFSSAIKARQAGDKSVHEISSPEQYYVHILIYAHRVDGLSPGIYYFDREQLGLSLLHEGDVRTHAKFVSCLQDIASDGIFAVSLIADMQSAFANYGERAYRYIQQEAGFIGQLFYLTARALDIDATGIGCFIDEEINQSLPEGMEVVYNFTFGKAVLDPRLSELPSYDFMETTSDEAEA